MFEHSHPPAHRVLPRAARRAARRRADHPPPLDGEHDPVTDWLLERTDLDAADFRTLFAIHKLRARPGRAGWIGHAELCRSTGLAAPAVGRAIEDLCRRGLLGMVRHPVKAGHARYMLIVQ